MTPALATAFENAPYTPVTGTAFQIATLLVAEPDNQTVGDAHYQEQGIFQITLMYPLQVGTATVMARAELIRTTFKRGNTFTSGGVRVVVTKTPEVSAGRIDGYYFSVPVRIRWQAFI